MGYNKKLFIEEEHEEWVWIPDYEGIYGCSKCGTVFSTHHGVKKVIEGKVDKDGYRSLILYDKNKNKKYVRTHRIVALCWLEGDRKLNVCHNDGDIINNHSDNLRYDTQKSNINDKNKHGTMLRGERHPRTSLSDNEALDIFYSEKSAKVLAEEYNVAKSVIYSIKSGKSWKHLHDSNTLDN